MTTDEDQIILKEAAYELSAMFSSPFNRANLVDYAQCQKHIEEFSLSDDAHLICYTVLDKLFNKEDAINPSHLIGTFMRCGRELDLGRPFMLKGGFQS